MDLFPSIAGLASVQQSTRFEAVSTFTALLAWTLMPDIHAVLRTSPFIAGGAYKSGKCDWIKVKCAQWKEANKHRGELFQRTR